MNEKAVNSFCPYILTSFVDRVKVEMQDFIAGMYAKDETVPANAYDGKLETEKTTEAIKIKLYYELETESIIQGLIGNLIDGSMAAKQQLRELVIKGKNAARKLEMVRDARIKAEHVKIKLTPIDDSLFYMWWVPWIVIILLGVLDSNLFHNLFTSMRMANLTAILFTIVAVLSLDFVIPLSVNHLITTRLEKSKVSAPAIFFLMFALLLLVGFSYMAIGNNNETRNRLNSEISHAEQNNDPDGNLVALRKQLSEVPSTREILVRSALPVATTALSILFILWHTPKALYLKKKKFIDKSLEEEEQLEIIVDAGLAAKSELDSSETVDKDALTVQLRADSKKAYLASLDELEETIKRLREHFRLLTGIVPVPSGTPIGVSAN